MGPELVFFLSLLTYPLAIIIQLFGVLGNVIFGTVV